MAIRVILVDDHAIVIEGLRAVLKNTASDILVVGEASNGNQALKMALTIPADIFVLDITMPGLNGLETMERLIHKDKKAKAIILSMHDDAATIRKAFSAGARGYLVKESAPEDIVKALRTVYKGQYYLSPSVTNVELSDMISAASGELEMRNTGLTSKERELIQMIAEGLGNKQIAYKLKISINTVKVHRHNISLKLNIHKQTDLVRYAIKEGIAKA
ncbi:MAG: response regulator transcription factor [Elusimicrobiota bacterium]